MDLVSDVEEDEATGAVGALGHAGCEAGLPEEGGLLVSGNPGDGDRDLAEKFRGGTGSAGVSDFGQQAPWNIPECEKLVIPIGFVEVVEEGA